MIAPALEQKVAELELRLGEAFDRIAQLERQGLCRQGLGLETGSEERQRLSQGSPEMVAEPSLSLASEPATPRQLVPRDSREMAHALKLCEEVFPGSTTQIEVLWDPSEPDWPWYSLEVRWKGEVRDSIDRQMSWHEKMEGAFPRTGDQFRIFVDLQ
jgi:hypothetical protein